MGGYLPPYALGFGAKMLGSAQARKRTHDAPECCRMSEKMDFHVFLLLAAVIDHKLRAEWE